VTHFSIRRIPRIGLSPGDYILFIRFLKVKKLLNNSTSCPACASNCNSLRASILDESCRDKEIIKVDVIARPLRRLRKSLNQVQDYCLCLISTISSLLSPTKLPRSTYSYRPIFDTRNMLIPDNQEPPLGCSPHLISCRYRLV
jgi:hypothetical protein